jgi:hypothetical protein
MRNQLETFKTLFEQIRGLGIVMQLPEGHNRLSENISLYFAEGYEVTGVDFGKWHNKRVDIMKYSNLDTNYKVSFPIDITDEALTELIVAVQSEFMDIKFAYLDSEIEKYRALSDVAELEHGKNCIASHEIEK